MRDGSIADRSLFSVRVGYLSNCRCRVVPAAIELFGKRVTGVSSVVVMHLRRPTTAWIKKVDARKGSLSLSRKRHSRVIPGQRKQTETKQKLRARAHGQRGAVAINGYPPPSPDSNDNSKSRTKPKGHDNPPASPPSVFVRPVMYVPSFPPSGLVLTPNTMANVGGATPGVGSGSSRPSTAHAIVSPTEQLCPANKQKTIIEKREGDDHRKKKKR